MACDTCGRGKFANINGSAKCELCPESQINTDLGQAVCTDCPSGFKGDSGRVTCISLRDLDTSMEKPSQPKVLPPHIRGSIRYSWDPLLKSDATEIVVQWSLDSGFESGTYTTKVVPKKETTVQLFLPNASGNIIDPRFDPVYVRLFAQNEQKKSDYSRTSESWVIARDCDDDSFLDDRPTDTGDWSCLPCPPGSSCKGKITWNNWTALFGWSRCPSDAIEICPFSAACLGASNPAMLGKFKGDPARLDHNESCNKAYQGFLCGACAPGFSHTAGDLSGKCDTCPEPGTNSAVAATGMVFAVLAIFIYIRMTLSDAGSKDTADGIKSIGLSFVQIISLLATFPVPWARMFTTLFQIGGAVTVLGQHFINLKCMFPFYSEAEVFYSSRIAWAVLPPLLSGACVLTWTMIHTCARWDMGRAFRDKLRTSVAALLYLIWAGLCSEVFSLFACRNLCGEYRLRADVEELCFEGRHWNYAVFLGVPMLLLYVVGFPALALVAVWRLHRRAERKNKRIDECAGHKTWGLIYSSFREGTWWWEGTVAARKIIVASIGVFGATLDRMQVHVTLILVFLIVLLTALVKPYSSHMLHWLEIGSLSALFATLWSASVFLTYPHCEVQGESVAWCEVIAVAVGSADIVVTLVVVVLFLRAKGGAKCLDACFAAKTRAREVLASVGRGITNVFDHTQDPEVVRARRQTRIRSNTVNMNDGTVEHRDNPLDGIEMAVFDTTVPDEPTRRKFKRYETEDGQSYFVEEGTEESVWDLPEDGEEVVAH